MTALDVLVGRWSVQPKVEGLGAAWSEFAWLDDGMFLRQVTDVDEIPETAPEVWRLGAPFPTYWVFGVDDGSGEFSALYADARGVHRVYRMTLADGEWRIWREAPGFNQRFIGALADDGARIDARWEFSEDGVEWRVDFELTYTREP